MGLYDNLSEVLSPHAKNLNNTIAAGFVMLHNRLDAIEKASSDLGRPDIGNIWQRVIIQKEFIEGEPTLIHTVPINEIHLIQAVVVDGIQEKSPAFIVTASGALVFSVIKEGVGMETPGGDLAALKGETLLLTARATGKISLTIHLIRRSIPAIAHTTHVGQTRDVGVVSSNTHDPERDIITSHNGIYAELPPEVERSR